jgi:hypothetical protein
MRASTDRTVRYGEDQQRGKDGRLTDACAVNGNTRVVPSIAARGSRLTYRRISSMFEIL